MTSPICSHLPSMASHGQGVCPCPLVGFGHVLGTGWWHFSTQDSVMVLSHWRSQTFPLTVSAPLLTWQEFPMDNWWPIQVCGSRGRCVGTLGSQIYCVKHNHPTKPGVDQQNPRRPIDMWATVNHSCSKALVPGGGWLLHSNSWQIHKWTTDHKGVSWSKSGCFPHCHCPQVHTIHPTFRGNCLLYPKVKYK